MSDERWAVVNSSGISIEHFPTKEEAEEKAASMTEYHSEDFFVVKVGDLHD